LFERYLAGQHVRFQREPELPGIPERMDFVLDHAECGKILLDVKDIENPPPEQGFGFFDPYRPIRTHIEAGRRKFRNSAAYVCGLVLAAPPTSFTMLDDPVTMMGAMYGDFGYQMSVNTEEGIADPDTLEPIYIPGKGKMIRKREIQNTRIAALIVVIDHHIWHHAMRRYLNTEDGRTRQERCLDIQNGDAGLPDESERLPGVTVWENAVAPRKLPRDLFRGEMDAWWEVTEDGRQLPTYLGRLRRELQVDKTALEKLGM
jgi:hypothetical protein